MSMRHPAATRATGAGVPGEVGALGAGAGELMSPLDGGALTGPVGAGEGAEPPPGDAGAGVAPVVDAADTEGVVVGDAGARPPRWRKGLCAWPRGAPFGFAVVRLTTSVAGVPWAGATVAGAAVSSDELPPERPRATGTATRAMTRPTATGHSLRSTRSAQTFLKKLIVRLP